MSKDRDDSGTNFRVEKMKRKPRYLRGALLMLKRFYLKLNFFLRGNKL